ncbi:MAG: rod shape-determining protein MreC [Alphaproteobacteria bacterium]|nr:rod shape-determining protein MreC [Alphaproteobacteria bacterium]
MPLRRTSKTDIHAVPLKMIGARATPFVLALLALAMVAFHRIGVMPAEQLRIAVTDVVAPVLETTSQPFVTLTESFEGVRTLRALKAENIRLKEENARLAQWYEAALKFQSENQSLRGLLNVKADPALAYVTARVVSDPGGAFVKSLLLPAGMNDDVTKGSAVLSGRGLVGRITEAGKSSSRVLLVTDLNSRIPVVIQNTRTRAILAGRNKELMRLERLPVDSGLVVGSRVVTSGDGGLLPADIPVGTIVSVEQDSVLVRPLSDLSSLSYVQVVNMDADESLISGHINTP